MKHLKRLGRRLLSFGRACARVIARRVLLFLIGIDQAIKGLIFGGSPDQTLSSLFFEAEQLGFWYGRILRPVTDKIFSWLEGLPGHCRAAFDGDSEHTWVDDGRDLSLRLKWSLLREQRQRGALKKKPIAILRGRARL